MRNEKYFALFRDITNRFAQESKCAYIKVASIAVRDSQIIATGLNGTPSGTENCEDHFIDFWMKNIIGGPHALSSNPELNTQKFHEWTKSEQFRKLHYEWSSIHDIHSEVSLVIKSAKNHISLEGCDLFCSYDPCQHCAKMLAALKPRCIYYINEYDKAHSESLSLLRDCGISVVKI